MMRKMFRGPDDKVYEFAADGSQDAWITPGMVPMSAAEIDAHLNPPLAPLTLEQVQGMRRAAYAAESDPLKNEAEYDALLHGTEPDYTAWLAAVEAIKARYPLPAAGVL